MVKLKQDNNPVMNAMNLLPPTRRATAVLMALGLAATVALPALAQDLTTKTAAASDAFPGLKGFLKLAAKDRSQIAVYYAVRVKHGDITKASITLNDGNAHTRINIGAGGRLSPLPNLGQLENGATVTLVYPTDATTAMKLHVYSTQPNATTYDAGGLALGIKQGNNAMGKIAGVLALGIPKLDRVYFPGGGNATVDVPGGAKPLPKTTAAGEYPAGTPYFVPDDFSGATKIHLTSAPGLAHFDNKPK